MALNKKIISIISLLLTILMIVSCQPAGIPTDTTASSDQTTLEITTADPGPQKPDGLVLAGPEIANNTSVIFPWKSDPLLEAANSFAKYVNKLIPGAELRAMNDYGEIPTTDNIIILEPDATLKYDYSIKVDGNCIKISGKDEESEAEALNYLKIAAIKDGYLVLPEGYEFTSNDGPKVLDSYPEKYYYYEDVYTPDLIYTYDEKQVVAESSKLFVSGVDLSDKAVWENGTVTLSGHTVEPGDHTVILALADAEGDVEVFETTFSCGDGSVMHLYSGEVHAHTADSDGKSTVEAAYRYARDVAKLDFFSVTDHSDSFSNSVYQNSHIPNADRYNDPGTFVALYGYEQTYNLGTGYYGHLNTLNYGSLTKRSLPLKQYYITMMRDLSSVVMFNHPGYKWGNFVEYAYYSTKADQVICLSEIKGKSYDTEYALSLTKGWHVSPMYNEDNHSENWGNAYEYCGYALAPALTRENIVEAFHKNRTYTTTDKSLKIYYKINDEWMGSRLNNPEKLKFRVELSTEKDYGLGTVSIIGEDNIVVNSITLGPRRQYIWEFEADPCYDYYYVKVEAGSGKTWCVTAPIWIEKREHLSMSQLTHSLLINNSSSTADHRIFADITNTTSQPLTDVEVEFFTSALTGFNELKQKPVTTAKVASIAPGETVTVYGDVPYLASTPRIYAVATAKQGELKYGAVQYLELSTLYVSEIVPITKSSDAYEYIELYNNSMSAIDLSKYKIRYYPKPGANADALATMTRNLSGTIKAHSTLVIWVVPEGSKLTVADFNKHYGTDLVEGKDIIRFVGINIPNSNPVQIEILNGSSIVTRTWYNWGEDVDAYSDKGILFNYPTDYTITAKVAKNRVDPTPGSLSDDQMPKLIAVK